MQSTDRLFASRPWSTCHRVLSGWYETSRGEQRVVAMEGLRGLAILLVFLCHFQMVVLAHLAEAFHSRLAVAGAELGGTGVDLFFLLSGMLIYRAAMRPNVHYLRFLSRRVQRIYPTFLAVLGFYLVLSMGLHVGEHYQTTGAADRLRYIAANLLLLPGIVDLPPVISAAWSLSYEFAFYLSIPVLVRLLHLRRWTRAHRLLFWSSLIVVYLAFALTHPQIFPQRRFQDATFVRFTLFLSGMIAEEVLETERGLRFLSTRMQMALLGAAGVAFGLLLRSEIRTVSTLAHRSVEHAVLRACLVLVIYLALTLATLQPKGILARLFSHTPLRWTGNASYSFYLIHGFVLNLVAALLPHLAWVRRHPFASAPMLFVVALASTAATATVLFLAVEKPFSLSMRPSKRAPEPARFESLPAGENA